MVTLGRSDSVEPVKIEIAGLSQSVTELVGSVERALRLQHAGRASDGRVRGPVNHLCEFGQDHLLFLPGT